MNYFRKLVKEHDNFKDIKCELEEEDKQILFKLFKNKKKSEK